jgi:glycerophosphoryl diester phosphodiesterase
VKKTAATLPKEGGMSARIIFFTKHCNIYIRAEPILGAVGKIYAQSTISKFIKSVNSWLNYNNMNKFLTVISILIFFNTCTMPVKTTTLATPKFDWQGHRGARGLLPENTVPAMLKALDLGVNTLECDLAVSADNQLIVSHEPWFNAAITTKPDGSFLKKEEEEDFLIYKMTVAEIQRFDCGSRGNPRFPEQQAMKAYKPTLKEMVNAVKAYCHKHKRPLPYFNIEIKSSPEWDNIRTPPVETFAQWVVSELKSLKIEKEANVQAFDPRPLEVIHKLNPQLRIAFLVENTEGVVKNLNRLTFKPYAYSPYYKLLNDAAVRYCHEQGIKVIPWTVNEVADMEAMLKLGVDGIITDYPNRIVKL